MDLKAKKLRIIGRILQNDDPQVLDTIENLLALSDVSEPNPIGRTGSLLPGTIPAGNNTDPELRELQDSIDAVFQANPHPGQKKDASP